MSQYIYEYMYRVCIMNDVCVCVCASRDEIKLPTHDGNKNQKNETFYMRICRMWCEIYIRICEYNYPFGRVNE